MLARQVFANSAGRLTRAWPRQQSGRAPNRPHPPSRLTLPDAGVGLSLGEPAGGDDFGQCGGEIGGGRWGWRGDRRGLLEDRGEFGDERFELVGGNPDAAGQAPGDVGPVGKLPGDAVRLQRRGERGAAVDQIDLRVDFRRRPSDVFSADGVLPPDRNRDRFRRHGRVLTSQGTITAEAVNRRWPSARRPVGQGLPAPPRRASAWLVGRWVGR